MIIEKELSLMNDTSLVEDIFLTLPTVTNFHSPNSSLYLLLKKTARKELENEFRDQDEVEKGFEPFGTLIFPYFDMGAVNSLNLFDLDELIIFSYYWINRRRYKRVLDIGANIGLHSILLDKCGFDVRSYEPDPIHYERLQKNLELNNCKHVKTFKAAVSSKTGEMEFTRVLGNTTGSHLSGSKKNAYGDLDKFPVRVEDIAKLIEWADLIKLDAEGHEKEILLSTTKTQWQNTDAIVEIENKDNAEAVFKHFNNLGINLFPQKINWGKAGGLDDLPNSYHEGSLFISSKDNMPWNA